MAAAPKFGIDVDAHNLLLHSLSERAKPAACKRTALQSRSFRNVHRSLPTPAPLHLLKSAVGASHSRIPHFVARRFPISSRALFLETFTRPALTCLSNTNAI
jgi:hypothetical protein